MNFMTVEDFAKRIQMHPNTVRKFIREGRVFASRPGAGKKASYRIAESELERLQIQSMCKKE